MKRYLILSLIVFLSIRGITQTITLELIQDGLNQPIGVQHAGDDRLFIIEKEGVIKIRLSDGLLLSTPFLDISDRITTNGERGLLGLAFHPDYSQNGYFYVNYTDLQGNTQISRFQTNTSNPNSADPNSEVKIIDYIQHESNHNGGDLMFGPDGYLYISSGDGGEFGDPHHRAQSLDELLGKILRIDVDTPSGGKNYGIPPDNPFINRTDARPEIWAYGLRNPWRFTIDVLENTIWIADVGQADREEINRQSLDDSGINYGWRCYEGSLPFNTTSCPPFSEFTFPIAEYPHDHGNCSITGGRVYRGSYSDLQGQYFFADYCSGMIATLDDENNIYSYGNFDGRWVAFGTDNIGDLYIVDIQNGKIYKIKGQVLGVDIPQAVSFDLFPNPTKDYITITSVIDHAKLEIYSIQGQRIFSYSEVRNDQKIDVSAFKSGIYLVYLKAITGQSTVKKLIIE